jgi:predicted DsbA family dithiol-disulfide isomerase
MKGSYENQMSCDANLGVCEISQANSIEENSNNKKPIRLLYFTDPICSSCWGIEPQLRKLKQLYGRYFDIEYRMGGLLKSWSEYSGSDVNGPSSVAQHWDEASLYYNMPIDGDIWKEDPLHSSYPPSIAFKAAQLQGMRKSDLFLRRIREMVFTEKKNITKEVHLIEAAKDAGLSISQFEQDFRTSAKQLFEEDLALTHKWGVRGFPTIFFIDKNDNQFKVYGSKPFEEYENALLKLIPGIVVKEEPIMLSEISNSYFKGVCFVLRFEFK